MSHRIRTALFAAVTVTALTAVVHPPSAVAAAGAAINGMTEYEAENASTNGSVIGPDYTQGDLATEASGRKAVQLSGGQYVQFSLTASADALNVHYSLSQGASGTLSVYVNGAPLSQKLALTSQYSYISTPGIQGSMTHHFYDDARTLLGRQLNAGDTVKLQVDGGDTAATIDVADLFQVPAAASQPGNSISVVDDGADASGNGDSTNAFRQAINDAAALGKSVWIPPGTFRVTSSLQANAVTMTGAGNWYSIVRANAFINNPTSSVPGPVNLSNFAILGSTVGRHDDSTQNAINGSLGSGSTVDGLWIQNTNVGFWLQGASDHLTVRNCVVFDTSADGLNLNGSATNGTITNNYLRNNGDDGLAIWSLYSAVTNMTFSNNTVVQPNIANGIAFYGGTGNTISNNRIADTNALGGGIDISNQQFLGGLGFTPLAGTITVSGNTLVRTGAMNPNWQHPMSAIRIDAWDYDISNPINLTDNTITDSPWSAIQFVSGSGQGRPVNGITVNGATINGTGTVVFQAETPGSAAVSNVTASDIGVAGVYDYGYPNNQAGTFALNLGSGNSGWSTTPLWTTFPQPGDQPPASNGNLALRLQTAESSHTQAYGSGNAVDGDANTYWESANSAFPQWLQVDLGSSTAIGSIVLKLPPAWGARTQTLSVLGSSDGGAFSTIKASADYAFDPASGNKVTIPVSATTRYVRVNVTANTGWPAGQVSELEVYAP